MIADSRGTCHILSFQLNHVFKTRDLVSKNNAKLTREEEGKREELLINGSSFLDHGFTRPKVRSNSSL